MKRILIPLFLILTLTACTPVMTPVPATATASATITPIPTFTAVPSATPEPTNTEQPTPTPTEVGPPPKEFASWADAKKYGWLRNGKGVLEQQIVRNPDGYIVLGDLLLEQVETKYEDHQFDYKFPPIDGKNKFPSLNFTTSIMPNKDFHYFSISFLVKNPSVLNNPSFAASGKDVTRFEVWMKEWDTPYAWDVSQDESEGMAYSLVTSADNEDPEVGALAITLLMAKYESLKTIKINRPGFPLFVIYKADK